MASKNATPVTPERETQTVLDQVLGIVRMSNGDVYTTVRGNLVIVKKTKTGYTATEPASTALAKGSGKTPEEALRALSQKRASIRADINMPMPVQPDYRMGPAFKQPVRQGLTDELAEALDVYTPETASAS